MSHLEPAIVIGPVELQKPGSAEAECQPKTVCATEEKIVVERATAWWGFPTASWYRQAKVADQKSKCVRVNNNKYVALANPSPHAT